MQGAWHELYAGWIFLMWGRCDWMPSQPFRGMSALLTTTMVYMKTVIEALEEAGLGHIKTCVGGAPVTQSFADKVGADEYAGDAASAVKLFHSFKEKAEAN